MNEQACADTFSEEDVLRLEALLGSVPLRGNALPVDALQGLFCALAIGPNDDVPAERWLAAALGQGADGAVDPGDEALALLERFFTETRRAVQAGTFAPRLVDLRRGRRDYAMWCRGFLDGVECSGHDWYASADPEEVDELLFPILLLADELPEAERRTYTPVAWRRKLLESERDFDASIRRLRDYWAIVKSPPQTVRRQEAKVGRNDPCPCGSGRKYKQCHGL